MKHFPGFQISPDRWSIHDISGYGESRSLVSLLELRDSSAPIWNANLDGAQLRIYLDENTNASESSIRLFFVSGFRKKGEAGDILELDQDILQTLVDRAGMSEKFFMDISEIKDWAKLNAGSSITPKASWPPNVTFHYGFWAWEDVQWSAHSFVECQTDLSCTTYFCINLPKACVERIVGVTTHDRHMAKGFLCLDSLVLDQVITTYIEAISERRIRLKRIEDRARPNTRKSQRSRIEVDAKELHDLCIQLHSIYNDLADLDEQLGTLQKLYNAVVQEHDIEHQYQPEVKGCQHTLQMLQSRCRSYSRWTTNYLERTNIRINLHHHLASAEIARQSERESRFMLLLSVVTTFFLPGTFVATILSTSFFEFNHVSLEVSQKWWILPASAAPLTVLVVAFLIWTQRLSRDKKKDCEIL
ncbi:hypothetical protein F4680DRAFT_432195 [Xylaria scruposa]|nr:hypothetical protein F4680DRAFT_432195 [Xylaria scruposa]